jgi:post-segregation antitoxin (ccd killing protein)
LPVMREEALRLARAWDIDVSRLRGEALTGALA